jgi:hypothetical protein
MIVLLKIEKSEYVEKIQSLTTKHTINQQEISETTIVLYLIDENK